MGRMLKSPWPEAFIMVLVTVLTYTALTTISFVSEAPEGGMATGAVVGWLFAFFVLSLVIALLGVLGGIGGGVMFTPVMLAFTPVDSLIIRGTGLIVAMFSGLISTGPFMRSGLANMRISVFLCCGFAIGAFTGANGAILVAQHMGAAGEGFVRLILGVILFTLALYFIFGGKKIEWPQVDKSDKLTDMLQLRQPFYEPSLKKVVDYGLKRSPWALLCIVGVGLLSGFFGLGAGWAIVPAQNLVMGVPLKVAAANSGVLLGMGDCIAVWPYIMMGAIIPIFAAPWLVGQVLGGLLGAIVLIRVKAGFVRYLLIGFMIFSCWGLVTRGLSGLGYIQSVPNWMTGVVFVVIFTWVIFNVVKVLRSAD
jgi:uncharacterized protein